MPDPITAITVGGTIITSIGANREQKKGAGRAAEAQLEAGEAAIGEQQSQLEQLKELLKPYFEAGAKSLEQQQAILGLGGADAEQEAIAAIESSPGFQAITRQGEEAILAGASATGGIRGGNVQRSLAQFRPSLLNQFITDKFSKLGGISAAGLSAAGTTGAAGLRTGENVSNLLVQGGEIQAAEALAKAEAKANVWGDIGTGFGTVAGGF